MLDDVLSHQVDLLNWLAGRGPDAARAEAAGPAGALRVQLRFGELTATCEAGHGPYAERLIVGLADGRLLEATGSRMGATGSAFPAWRRQRALLLDRVALARGRLGGRLTVTNTSFGRQLEDFVRGVQGGAAVGATADDGVRVLQVLEACRESLRSGRSWRAVAT